MKKQFGGGRLRYLRLYLSSLYQGIKHREAFQNVKKYCMFIGYPRSGHSLVGALLDAHPNAVISHELDALKYIDKGFKRRQIYYLLLEKSQFFAESGHQWTGYSYHVPNQWQGKHERLQIIGDKKGGKSSTRFFSNPQLFEVLKGVIHDPIVFIHVIRNPYDNISTIFKKEKMTLEESVNHYFTLCESVMNVKRMVPESHVLDLKHELLIDDPKVSLQILCSFLGLEATSHYLSDCSSIVFKSPNKSRNSVEWSSELIEKVKENMARFDFLKEYSYEN